MEKPEQRIKIILNHSEEDYEKGEEIYPYIIDDDKIVFKNAKTIVRNLEYYKRLYESGDHSKEVALFAAFQAKRLEDVKDMLSNAVTEEQFQRIISSIEDYIEKHPEEFQEDEK